MSHVHWRLVSYGCVLLKLGDVIVAVGDSFVNVITPPQSEIRKVPIYIRFITIKSEKGTVYSLTSRHQLGD